MVLLKMKQICNSFRSISTDQKEDDKQSKDIFDQIFSDYDKYLSSRIEIWKEEYDKLDES